MQRLREDVDAAARSDAKVLIVGETGVGKEIVARMIHETGRRRTRNFVTINCAGLPDSLLESELFGHVRGSFTGAYRDKPGLAAMAHNGTLFLDELGETSLRMQALLLRFVENGEIQRVGSDRIDGRVDVRIIAATNRNLAKRIGEGEFREDLYYRLNVIRLAIPPLRERGDDVTMLLRHYLSENATAHQSICRD
jgi:anaerobic nitric oxide reductase transcription regulator